VLVGDRIVYLVEKLPRNHTDSGLEFVDDAGLSALMADGFEVSSTLPERKVQANGKTVKASMMVLRPAGENRGLSVRGRERERDDDGGGRIVVHDGFGTPRSLTPAQATMHEMTRALGRLGAAGHLGPAGDHNMPGLTIISGEMVGKAFDLGLLAAMRGEPKTANQFPAGSEASTLWLQGWYKGQKANQVQIAPSALTRAEEEGYALAQSLGADDVVSCPYPNPQLKTAWLDGFKRGGGRIEQG
jgi:ribosome modulation factor